jgi:ABC-type oligopeptide transport system ATPase subunit
MNAKNELQTAALRRVFKDTPATRKPTPTLLGVVGPSRSGKTFSALRLATGLQRITPGEIFMIDSEADRGVHYADRFTYRHIPFAAPFSPYDYMAAIKHCVDRGAKHIIIDSMSHEHEGPGGVLEHHAAEVERLGGGEKNNFSAWNKPKSARRALINYIIQQKCNFVFCFRAKEKTKIENGKLTEMGFQAIAGEEFLYEMTQNFLLLPGAKGSPTWKSNYPGEQELIQRMEQFAPLYEKKITLDEDTGEYIGRWCSGAAWKDGLPASANLPAANTQSQPKAPAKAQPKPTQPVAKPESGAPANGLRFHQKFGEHGGQLIEGAEPELRNEYDSWLTEQIANLSPADRPKGQKHQDEFRELHLQLTAEEHLRAEESAA